MEIIHTFSIDFGRNEVPPHLSLMQNDSARKILAKLYDNNVVWNVPSGASVYIAFRRPDEKNLKIVTLADSTPVATYSGNEVTVTIPPELTANIGNLPVVIVFIDGCGKQIATFPISVSVLQNPAVDGEEVDPISPNEFEQLLSALAIERARVDEIVSMRGDAQVVEYVQDFNINDNGRTAIGECIFRSNGCNVDIEVTFTALFISTETSGVELVGKIPSEFVPLQTLPIMFFDNLYNETVRLFINNNADGNPALYIRNDGTTDFNFNAGVGEDTGEVFVRTASYALKSPVVLELLDARVGYDGTIYKTAGDAIREQANKTILHANQKFLIVTATDGVTSKTAEEIVTHIKTGGLAYLYTGEYIPLVVTDAENAFASYISDEGFAYYYEINGNRIHSTLFEYATEEQIGNIETALDSILAIQNDLIGGDA